MAPIFTMTVTALLAGAAPATTTVGEAPAPEEAAPDTDADAAMEPPPTVPSKQDPGGEIPQFVDALPLQSPVPPPPASEPRYGRVTRWNRWLDPAAPLSANVAREMTAARLPRWGGHADLLMARDSQALGDLRLTLDGIPLNVPLARRGPGWADMDLLPRQAIESFTATAGPSAGGFAGSVALRSRRLNGTAADILLGEGRQWGLAAAGGRVDANGEALLAIESTHARLGRTNDDDRLALFGRASRRLGNDLSVSAWIHGYRQVWQEPAALGSGSGELEGANVAGTLAWQVGPRLAVRAAVGHRADRVDRREVASASSNERDRVTFAEASVTSTPAFRLPTRLELSVRGWHDRATGRALAGRRTADWFLGELRGLAELELGPGVTAEAELGIAGLTIRGLGERTSEDLPDGAMRLAFRRTRWGTRLSVGQSHRTPPEIWLVGPTSSVLHHSADLELFGCLPLGTWRLDWRAGGFASRFGPQEEVGSPREQAAYGAELAFDLEHLPSHLLLVTRGGGWSSQTHGATPTRPWVAHAGLLRRAERGLLAEAWVELYDRLVRYPSGGNQLFTDLSARLGWSTGPITIWLAGENLLDAELPLLFAGQSWPRQRRRFFLLLSLAG